MNNDSSNPIQSFLAHQSTIIVDGALATELTARGADLRDPLWSAKLLLEDPDLIRQVHYDYFCAGADVAITSTYQATFEGFIKRGLSRTRAAELMRLSVSLAHEAREQFCAELTDDSIRLRPLVAASVGPYGAYLHDGSEYRGDYGLTVSQLMDFHRPRMALLVETMAQGCADLLACETIPSRLEAEALVRLLDEEFHVPAWLCFSCQDEERLCDGTSFAVSAELVALSRHICAVGINCTPPNLISPLLQLTHGQIDRPLVVYPNSGEGWDAVNKRWLPCETQPSLIDMASAWSAAGARLIGGCCRTNPADIRAIRQHLIP